MAIVKSLTPETYLADVYLRRLARLLRLQRNFGGDFNHLGAEMIWRSVDATYAECVREGVRDQANALLCMDAPEVID